MAKRIDADTLFGSKFNDGEFEMSAEVRAQLEAALGTAPSKSESPRPQPQAAAATTPAPLTDPVSCALVLSGAYFGKPQTVYIPHEWRFLIRLSPLVSFCLCLRPYGAWYEFRGHKRDDSFTVPDIPDAVLRQLMKGTF